MSGGIPHFPQALPSGLGNPSNIWLVAAQGLSAQAQMQNAMQQSGLVTNQVFLQWPPPPSRAPISRPDPRQPDTLGWREWVWNGSYLVSPSQGTEWRGAEHIAHQWDEADVIRGVAGIHALLVPRHWKLLGEFGVFPVGGGQGAVVTGIVERFGRYVLGTEGWRAEQVVIRELLAPSTEIGLELEQRYPDVIVHYPEEEEPCKSERSSESEKGSRSLLPSTSPSPSVNPPSPPSLASIQAQHLAMFPVQSPPLNQRNLTLIYSQCDDPGPPASILMRLLPVWFGVCGAWAGLLLMRFFA